MPDMRSSPPIVKAFLAGCAGGLAGSAAKVMAEKLVPPRTQGQTPPPKQMVGQIAAAAALPLPPPLQDAGAEAVHWTFGTVAGGAYGVAAEFQPEVTAWRGAVFGLSVNKLMHEGVLPGAGLVKPVAEQPAQERVSEWVTHVVYGIVTETVRRMVRKRL